MQTTYAYLRQKAREIAAGHPSPDFYRDFCQPMEHSRKLYQNAGLVQELKEFVRQQTQNNLGHGLAHAETVALDAGTIAAVETRGTRYAEEERHLILLAHCAGLLHDIKRTQPDHAQKGANAARKKLEQYQSLASEDIDCVAFAIANHEAFKHYYRPRLFPYYLIAGSLYDADKFRWGPENFTHTVWDMIAAAPLPVEEFVRLYPRAIHYINKIKTTFRTAIGQRYGPQFIDIGLNIGETLWQQIKPDDAADIFHPPYA